MKAERPTCFRERPRWKRRRLTLLWASRSGRLRKQANGIEAWVGYLKLPAPFDGVIVSRNAIRSISCCQRRVIGPRCRVRLVARHRGPLATMRDRRSCADLRYVPEQDADHVQIGTKASVVAKAFSDHAIPGTVRVPWALNEEPHALPRRDRCAQCDSRLLPGMYADAKVMIERPGVPALPVAASRTGGEKSFAGSTRMARRSDRGPGRGLTDGRGGTRGDKHFRLQRRPDPATWSPLDGSEEVILGDLSILALRQGGDMGRCFRRRRL